MEGDTFHDTPCIFRRPLNASIAINKHQPLQVTQYDAVSLYLQRTVRVSQRKRDEIKAAIPGLPRIFSHLPYSLRVRTYLSERYELGRSRVECEICEGEMLNRDGDLLEKPRDILRANKKRNFRRG